MRQAKTLSSTSDSLIRRVFADCCESLLGVGLSRHYLCNPCMGVWSLTPEFLSGAYVHFFPESNGLTIGISGSARSSIYPRNATLTRCSLSRLQTFLYVQTPTLTRPPGCTYRNNSLFGSWVRYTAHSPSDYSSQDAASLHVRHGQLTWLNFH